jgi:hypothetical protein
VESDGRRADSLVGRIGTVLWCSPPRFDRGAGKWSEWMYCVCFPQLDRCRSFLESNLRPTGRLDAEAAHLGRRYEISFDTVLDEDAVCAEGSYRVPGRPWEIFFFAKRDVPGLRHELSTWPSGITGIEFDVPRTAVLDRDAVLRWMSEVFGAETWVEVRGPDSLLLK